jgi:deoxyribonuclease V
MDISLINGELLSGDEQMISSGAYNDLIRNARAVQERLRARYSCGVRGREKKIRLVGGADAAYSQDTGIGVIALLSFPDFEPIGHAIAIRKVLFPYLPGLFAFREAPLLLAACEKLGVLPDLLFVNGHGFAHPRRFGLACHTGALLDIPTIGVASQLLCGSVSPAGPEQGSSSLVTDNDEAIGMLVRTKAGSKPVCVSAGYLTDLPYAVEMTLACLNGNRLPLPLHAVDRIAREYLDRVKEGTPHSGV